MVGVSTIPEAAAAAAQATAIASAEAVEAVAAELVAVIYSEQISTVYCNINSTNKFSFKASAEDFAQLYALIKKDRKEVECKKYEKKYIAPESCCGNARKRLLYHGKASAEATPHISTQS